ncbi:MAG: type II secretion system protein [Patescibacteria group bacterium]
MKTDLSEKGFTLLELLVVISIIAMLSGIVMASVSVSRKNAKNAKFADQLVQTHTAMTGYFLDRNSYPPVTGNPTPTFVSNATALSLLESALVPTYLTALPEGLSLSNNDLVVYRTAPNLAQTMGVDAFYCGSPNGPFVKDYLIYFDYAKASGGTFTAKKLYEYSLVANTVAPTNYYCIGE